jgi:hypothetical protein
LANLNGEVFRGIRPFSVRQLAQVPQLLHDRLFPIVPDDWLSLSVQTRQKRRRGDEAQAGE